MYLYQNIHLHLNFKDRIIITFTSDLDFLNVGKKKMKRSEQQCKVQASHSSTFLTGGIQGTHLTCHFSVISPTVRKPSLIATIHKHRPDVIADPGSGTDNTIMNIYLTSLKEFQSLILHPNSQNTSQVSADGCTVLIRGEKVTWIGSCQLLLKEVQQQ
jgi:hypothetical protein